MGSLYRNGRVRSYIMILLVLTALLISAPVKKLITAGVNDRISSFTTLLHEKTGLSISYERLSPSILSNFYIHNIRIFDEDGDQLLSVNKTRITYSLINLFKKDFQRGISSVVIDGINLDVDELVKLASKFRGAGEASQGLAEVKKVIPENIKLKNIYLEYSDEKVSALLNVKSIGVSNSLRKKTIDIQADSILNANLAQFKKIISGKLSFAGTLTDDFDGSQLNLRLRDFTDGDYRLNKLNLHASYTDGTVEMHTIQAVNPISLGVFYDFKTGDVNGQFRMEKLKPLSLLTINSKQVELKKFRDLTMSTDTIVKCNINDRTFNFITDTSATIPSSVFPGGLNLAFSLYGDEKKAELTNLSVNGENCTASSQLSLVYETKQLSGFIELPEYHLPNGKIISTEVYFDPLDKGFMAFSPQLFIGDRSLAAIQLTVLPQPDSYDFTFEVSDYSHLEEIEPGMIRVDGSYLNASKYFQSNITLSSLYLDSIAALTAQLLPEETAKTIASVQKNLEPYLLSGDVYASTDLKTFSYNVPYILLANTKSDNQALMLSLNGSESSIQLNQLSLIAGKYTLEAAASLDRAPDSSDMFFTADIKADSIPYHFAGTIMQEVCTVTGDYGTDVEVRFGKNHEISGHALLQSLPVKLMDTTLIISTTSDFSYDEENGPSVKLTQLEVEEAGSLSVNPKIVLSGNATRYGAQLDSIAYTDLYSVLEGSADLMLNINEKIFDSVGLMVNLKNPLSDETLIIDGSISNPEHLPLTKENLLQRIYMNLQMQIKNFSLNRFSSQKNDNNMISGMVFTSGTIEHPYVSLSVESLSMLLAANMLYGRGNIILEDRDLSISDLNINFAGMNFSNIQASANLLDMNLSATGDFDIKSMGKTIHAPLELTVGNAIIPEGSFIPDSLSVTLSTKQFSGSMLKKPFPLSFSVLYANDLFSISSSPNAGLYGSYTKDGLLELNLNNGSFLSAKLDGLVNMERMNLELYDVEADLHKICSYLNIDDLMIIDSGILGGDIILTGNMNDPEMNGIAQISSPVVRIPLLTKQKLSAPQIGINIVNNEITIPETIVAAKNNQRLAMSYTILLNKWNFDHMEGYLKTYKDDQFAVDFKTPEISLNGNIVTNLNMYFENDVFELNGKIFGENVELGAQLFALANMTSGDSAAGENPLQVVADLAITLGTHASVQLDPFLRCIFVPNTTMRVTINQPDGIYAVDGELKLKSGDLAYLGRSFYIKSGSVKFNKENIANPMITVNAETREKDESGQTVKIILNVEDQYLMDMQPSFSSVPPKSENEIRTLLGQIVMADSNSAVDFVFAASDYALQSTVVRQAENKLRNLLNFDIFSLRTNVLQNTYNMSVSRSLQKENISIGNFLDNTTVYIGKYLGSSLYVDAMLHVSFEDSKVNDIAEAGRMLFQPEFGMELESPFANIRVNMAPDINALLKNQFVPSTSVTLSWKFAF